MNIGSLQLLMARHGRWIDKDEAEDLCASDLPADRFVEEALARSRPLTDDERHKFEASGLTDAPRSERGDAC